MKFIAITFVLVILGDICLARNKLEDAFRALSPHVLESEVTLEILQDLTRKFVPLALENVKIRHNGERAPVIPDLPDPISLPNGDYSFNLTDILVGDLSVMNQEIRGLSTLKGSLALKLACEPFFGLGVIFGVDLSSLLFEGEYETDLMLGMDPVTGNGTFRLGVENTTASFDMVIGFQPGIPNKFQIHALTVDLFIAKLILFAENFVIGDSPIGEEDWDAVSTNILKLIMDSWPLLQRPISTFIKDVINAVIKECTIVDYLLFILTGEQLTCLSVPTIPSGVISAPTDPIDKTYTEFLPLLLAKAEETGFGQDFIKSAMIYALDKIQTSDIMEMGPGSPGQGRVSILPPFDDPWELEEGALPFNLLGVLRGNLSLWDGVIEGLSSVDDDLTLALSWLPFGIKIRFTLAKLGNVVTARLNGNHSSEFDILLPPIQPIRVITGNGELTAGITNAGLKLGVVVGLQPGRPTHLKISNLELDLGYDEMELFVENVFLGDCLPLPDYWQGVTDFIRWVFNVLWANNPNKQPLLTFLTNIVNNVIKDCSIIQLVGILTGSGDTSCLGNPFQPIPATTPGPSVPDETTLPPAATTPNAGAQMLNSFKFKLLVICIFTLFCYNRY